MDNAYPPKSSLKGGLRRVTQTKNISYRNPPCAFSAL